MALTLLPDTNAISALRSGNTEVLSSLNKAQTVLLSTIVLGELRFGYLNGTRIKDNLDFLERFLAKPGVKLFPVDEAAADSYARIRLELKKAGTPIPSNDLWIVSQAMSCGAVLLSADAYFGLVPGLRLQTF
jgi:tRNA(fMet)-specific endonuclease VapC